MRSLLHKMYPILCISSRIMLSIWRCIVDTMPSILYISEGPVPYMPVIVNRLSRLMGERRLKVADLQRMTGLSRGTLESLYKDESTRVDIATLDKLCTALGVTTSDILEHVQPDPA